MSAERFYVLGMRCQQGRWADNCDPPHGPFTTGNAIVGAGSSYIRIMSHPLGRT